MPQSTKPCEVAGAEEASDDILFLTNVATYCVKRDALITERVGSRRSLVVASSPSRTAVLFGEHVVFLGLQYHWDYIQLWSKATLSFFNSRYCFHHKLLKTTRVIDYSLDRRLLIAAAH